MAGKLNEEALEVLTHYYYPRAKYLHENCNWGDKDYRDPEVVAHVNDDLMTHINIYDCYTRNAAGFSNVLQDLKFAENTPKFHVQDEQRRILSASNANIKWELKTWFYVFMCHRITGSGASFEDDHGYRNNILQYWGQHRDIEDMANHLISHKASGKPLFTSKGNQPPSPKKGISCVDFMTKELPGLLDGFIDWLLQKKRGHKDIVDYLNEYNVRVGHKRFNFVYSAFAMDISDYYPELIDVDSHTYLGNNALRCMKDLSSGYDPDAFMDVLVDRTGGKAKDLEDVMCDFIRFGQNYVPRGNGTFDHIPADIKNNSGWDSGWEQRTGTPVEAPSSLENFFE